MATSEELYLKMKFISAIAARDSSDEVRSAEAKAKELYKSFCSAIASNDSEKADSDALRLLSLAESLKELDKERTPIAGQSWPRIGMGALGFVFLAVIAFLTYYVRIAGFQGLSSIEGTRPLLVVTAIVSTIAFGGALLVGSLFSAEGTVEDRFRRAREVFLVFSGIFGTVVGFYFGSSDPKAGGITLDAFFEEATLVGYVAGGSPPYSVTTIYGPENTARTIETKTGLVRIPFDKKTDFIIPFRISATDSRGVHSVLIRDFAKTDLKKDGWTIPAESELPATEPNPPADKKGIQPAKSVAPADEKTHKSVRR